MRRSVWVAIAIVGIWIGATGAARGQEGQDAIGPEEQQPQQGMQVTKPETAALPETPILEGPIDPRVYRLGPGDLLNVRIGVKSPLDRILRVSPEGRLIFPEGALVSVSGRTIAETESTLTVSLSRYYREPDVRVSLLELRTFGVFVVGEVGHPGMVVASPADRASAAIARAGGTMEKGSHRAILLTRRNGEILRVDLGQFEQTGSLSEDPLLEDGDRIYVPPTASSAIVGGAVMVPGPYETIPGDSVGTLIRLAHGLREDALLDSAYVESFEGSARRSLRVYLDLRDPAARRAMVRPRDLLFVRPRPYWTATRSVVVEGEVQHPGTHALTADSLPLTRVIALAGGFTDLASLRGATVSRPQGDLPPDPEFDRLSKLPTGAMTPDEHDYYILKLRGTNSTISTDFVRLFQDGDRSSDIFIRPGDTITIPRTEPYVMVLGEVTRPGNVPFAPLLTADDYIQKAGGYSFRAAKGRVTVIRAVTGEWIKKGKADPIGPGDTIWIPQKRRVFWKNAITGIGVVSQLATIYLVISNAVK